MAIQADEETKPHVGLDDVHTKQSIFQTKLPYLLLTKILVVTYYLSTDPSTTGKTLENMYPLIYGTLRTYRAKNDYNLQGKVKETLSRDISDFKSLLKLIFLRAPDYPISALSNFHSTNSKILATQGAPPLSNTGGKREKD